MDYGSLTYAVEGTVPQTVSLRPGVTTLGSAPQNDIVLDGPEVSFYHARILCTAEDCWVMDLDSAEGTFLNQVRLRPNARYPLRDGDILRIGFFYIRYTGSGNQSQEEDLTDLLKGIVRDVGAHRRPQVLPPDVAARLAQVGGPPSRGVRRPPVRRLRGNVAVRSSLALRSADGVSSYLQYMPPPYQDNEFLARFLLIFESIIEPLEQMIDNIHHYFDPRLAPESLLPWLASLVDMVLNEKWPVERRRALILAAAELYRWRGTRRGLIGYIRIYTDVEPTIVEPHLEGEGGDSTLPPNVFKVILEVPDPDAIDRELVEAIIEIEKPAHAGYILEIRPKESGAA